MSEPKAKNIRWMPDERLKSVVGQVTAILESLDPRGRGYLMSRLNATYGKKGKPASKKPKPVNVIWKKTPEYVAWKQAEKEIKDLGVKLPPEDPRVVELGRVRILAFRKKSELKPGTGQKVSNPADDDGKSDDPAPFSA
jgi:hypothetical protein